MRDPRAWRPRGARRGGGARPGEGRREPRYEPAAAYVPWIIGLCVGLVLLAGTLAWVDSSWLNDLNDRRASGWTDVPPPQATLDEIAAFGADQGQDCASVDQIIAFGPGCDDTLSFVARANDYDSESGTLYGMLVLAIAVLAIPFLGFTHRASANLRRLGVQGQRFTPGRSVLWFLVPLANLVVPFRIYRELWLASHASAGPAATDDPPAWQNGPSPGLVFIWWSAVLAAVFLSPTAVALVAGQGDIDGWVRATEWLVWSDLLLAAPPILTAVLVTKVAVAQARLARLTGVAGQSAHETPRR